MSPCPHWANRSMLEMLRHHRMSEREDIPPLWRVLCFINPNRSSHWQTLTGNTCHNPTIRMRCMLPQFSLNLGRLLKLITTTNVTNETLVSLGAQMPAATGVAFICTPAATATVRQTACQVEPSCLTLGSFLSPVSLSETAALKRWINCWSGRWSGDALKIYSRLTHLPSVLCIPGSATAKASISKTSAPDQSSR